MGGESVGVYVILYYMMMVGLKCLFKWVIVLFFLGVEVFIVVVVSKIVDYLLKNLDCDISENKLSCLWGKIVEDIVM